MFVEELRNKQLNGFFDILNEILGKHTYLTGETFTVADVAVGAYLGYLPVFFPNISIDAWPHLSKYVQRLMARDHFKTTVGAKV